MRYSQRAPVMCCGCSSCALYMLPGARCVRMKRLLGLLRMADLPVWQAWQGHCWLNVLEWVVGSWVTCTLAVVLLW